MPIYKTNEKSFWYFYNFIHWQWISTNKQKEASKKLTNLKLKTSQVHHREQLNCVKAQIQIRLFDESYSGYDLCKNLLNFRLVEKTIFIQILVSNWNISDNIEHCLPDINFCTNLPHSLHEDCVMSWCNEEGRPWKSSSSR